jgi:flagellar motor switch protein FliN/FliY
MIDRPDKIKDQFERQPDKEGEFVDASARIRPRIHSSQPVESKIDVEDLDFLGDVPLKLNMVLGEATMSLGEVIALESDSIVQLDKPSGEPVDIYVEDQLLGSGEVLVLHEKIRIRLLEVASPTIEEQRKIGHPEPEPKEEPEE